MKLSLKLDSQSDKPLVTQIQDGIRAQIVAGELHEGDRLPTMRHLSTHLNVSMGTVRQALGTLVNEGFLLARRGSGVVVASPQDHRQDFVLVLPSAQLEQMGRIIDGINAGIKGLPYRLVVQAANTDFDEQMHLLSYLDKPFVAGVILATPGVRSYAQAVERLVRAGTPCIQTVRYLQDAPTDGVVADAYRMGMVGLGYLLERGHRRIGLIDTTSDERMALDLRKGFAAALRKYELGMEDLPRICTSASDLNPHEPWKIGQQAAEQLLRDHPDLTALVGVNGHMTLGAYYALRKARKRIPDDVSVLALEHDLMVFRMTEPPVTVLDLPLEAIAERAVMMLHEIVESRRNCARAQVTVAQLEPRLIERESVADLRDRTVRLKAPGEVKHKDTVP